MKLTPRLILVSALVVALSTAAVCPRAVDAQQKRRPQTQRPTGSYLPPATFPSYAGSSAATPGYAFSQQGSAGAAMTPQGPGYGGVAVPQQDGQWSGGRAALPAYGGLNLEGSVGHARGKVEAYDPGEPGLNGALVRWDPSRFPLRIWISEGKKLPDDGVPFEQLVNDRVPRVLQILQTDPRLLDRLPPAPGWIPEVNDWAATGFDLWKDMEREGVISFGYVDDPAQADVLVFFTDRFNGADGPGGTSVHGQTYGQVFTAQQVQQKIKLGQRTVPLVIELKVPSSVAQMNKNGGQEQGVYDDGRTRQNFTANAAHEFGHALGIKAHSPYFDDLMYVNRTVMQPSQSDKATLRLLYRKAPQYWYF